MLRSPAARAESLGQWSSLFNDQNAPLILDPRPSSRFKTNHYGYVDNLGLLCFGEGTVGTKLLKAVGDFTSVGLELHETAAGSSDRGALEIVLSCDFFHSRLATFGTFVERFLPCFDTGESAELFWRFSLGT